MDTDLNVQDYVLGLDIGSASIGWALIGLDESQTPVNLIRAGVRIFEPGVEGSALNIEQGKDKSRALERRTARLQRRQIRRRAARQRDLFLLLQSNGLLPQSDPSIRNLSLQRHDILNRLDREQIRCERSASVRNGQVEQLLPYVLRKAALDRKLAPFELGRVLYHLCQRRGFKSNRRAARNENGKEELGKVTAGISELEQEITAASARTLGELAAQIPQRARRINP